MGAVYRARRLSRRRAGGDQAAAGGAQRAALPDRGAAARPAAPPARRARARPRRVDEHGDVLVMELVRGPSLASVLVRARARCRSAQAVEYARQACEALAYIHAQHDRPPRRQAGEPDPGRRRHRARRLRDRARRPRRRPAADRRAGHAALRGARGAGRRRGLAAQRRLRAGRDAVGADRGRAAGVPRARLAGRAAARASRASWMAALAAALEPDPHLRLPSAEAFARALGEGLRADRGASLSLASRARPPPAPVLGDDRPLRRRRVRRRRRLDRVPGRRATSSTRPPGARAPRRSSASGWGPAPGIAAHVAASGRARGDRRPAATTSRFAHVAGREHRLRPEHDARPAAGPGAAGRSACSRSSTASTASRSATGDLDRGAALAELALTALGHARPGRHPAGGRHLELERDRPLLRVTRRAVHPPIGLDVARERVHERAVLVVEDAAGRAAPVRTRVHEHVVDAVRLPATVVPRRPSVVADEPTPSPIASRSTRCAASSPTR